MGIFGMVWAFASAIGPVIGGALAERTTWRCVFYLNLPCGGAAFFALLLFLKVHNPRTKLWDGLVAMDWLDTFLVSTQVLGVFSHCFFSYMEQLASSLKTVPKL
jgi:MFS family permease